MKISRILSTSVLVGAVFFAGTACSAPSNATPDTAASTEAKPESKPAAPAKTAEQIAAEAVDAEAVAVVVAGYYNYVADPSNLDAIRKAGEPIKGGGDAVSPEQWQQVVDALPAGFQYFDVSSPELIKSSYAQLRKNATIMGKRKMTVTVPASAVAVNGNEAIVKSTEIETTMDGQPGPGASIPGARDLNLKKNEAGTWVIVTVN